MRKIFAGVTHALFAVQGRGERGAAGLFHIYLAHMSCDGYVAVAVLVMCTARLHRGEMRGVAVVAVVVGSTILQWVFARVAQFVIAHAVATNSIDEGNGRRLWISVFNCREAKQRKASQYSCGAGNRAVGGSVRITSIYSFFLKSIHFG